MTDLSSIMDKIRILRSGRRKTTVGKATSKEGSVTKPPLTQKLALSHSNKKLVPYLVLDIDKAKNSLQPADGSASIGDTMELDVIPALTPAVSKDSSAAPVTHTNTTVTSDNNTVIKTVTSKRSSPRKNKGIPARYTIIVKSSDSRIKDKKSKEALKEPPKHLQNGEDSSDETQVISNSVNPANVPMTISVPSKTHIISNSLNPAHEPVTTSIPSKTQVISNAVYPVNVPVTISIPAKTRVVSNSVNPARVTMTTSIPSKTQVISSSINPAHVVPITSSIPSQDLQNLELELQKEDENLNAQEMNFNTNALAPVGCVICSKQFSTLSEMQIHYLSEHKNRRGRENRKRNSEEIPKTTSNVAVKEKEDANTVNAGFHFPLYVNESDPKCPVCSIAFKNALEVKNHVKLVHSYRCSECKDTFYTLFEFTGHKCSKNTKKARRKKSGRNSCTIQEGEKMKSSTPLVPNIEENPKVQNDGVNNLLPSLVPKTVKPGFLPIEEASPSTIRVSNLTDDVQICKKSKLQITSVSHQTEPHFPNIRTPSPKLTISPLEKKTDPPKVRVLETKNLRCFKFKKDEIVYESSETRKDVIQEKILQLKNNPHLSVSWIPKLQGKDADDGDYEYVCGRCNVICDDMEDYTDHIQDCLTITSVTMERTSNPPKRILKLQQEVSSFGFQETNNNKYTVNKNLMKQLQAVLPLTEDDVRESATSPRCHQNEVFYSGVSVSSSDLTLKGIPNNSNSRVETPDQDSLLMSIKDEPIDDYYIESPKSKCSSDYIFEAVGPSTKKNGNSKGPSPMVIIPLGNDTPKNLPILVNDQSVNGKQAAKLSSPGSSSPSSLWDSSSTDLLIDTDDIKMEVEEEVIDDHYENF